MAKSLVKQYLASLSYLVSRIILSSSTLQFCFNYYQKYSCQAVSDKPVKTFNKNMRVKQYLTRLL